MSKFVQSFTNVEHDWQWSDELGRPEIAGEIDLQELRNSFADCALDKILDKFFPDAYKRPPANWPAADSDDIAECVEPVDLPELPGMIEKYKEVQDIVQKAQEKQSSPENPPAQVMEQQEVSQNETDVEPQSEQA